MSPDNYTVRPTLRRFYERIEHAREDIEPAEIRAYLKKIRAADGMFGDRATAEIMQILDTSGDEKVQWKELVEGGAKLLPTRAQAEDLFETIVKKKKKNKDRADAKDLARYLEPEFRRLADSPIKAMFAGAAAAAASKVAIDAIAADDGKTFTKEDLFALLDDIQAEKDRL